MLNQDVLENLIKGYQIFHDKFFHAQENPIYQDLAKKGQAPKVVVIACSDSRVDPATILNCRPGEIFVIRNVANLVPPCEYDDHHHGTSAALEFAVRFLQVEHIIIFGHSDCGGIRALLNDNTSAENQFINRWMDIANDAKTQALSQHINSKEQEKICCEHSLMISLNNLMTFPWIKKPVTEKKLHLHAWHFNLENGLITKSSLEDQKFKDLVQGKTCLS